MRPRFFLKKKSLIEVYSSKYITYLCSNIVKRLLIDVFKIQKVRLGCSAHRDQKRALDPMELELTGCYELPSVDACDFPAG